MTRAQQIIEKMGKEMHEINALSLKGRVSSDDVIAKYLEVFTINIFERLDELELKLDTIEQKIDLLK